MACDLRVCTPANYCELAIPNLQSPVHRFDSGRRLQTFVLVRAGAQGFGRFPRLDPIPSDELWLWIGRPRPEADAPSLAGRLSTA